MNSVPINVVFQGRALFDLLSSQHPSPLSVILKDLVPLALLPPIFLFVGTSQLGWQIGAEQPIEMGQEVILLVCVCYFVALVSGFIGVAAVLRWMAPTYAADTNFANHLVLVAVVATPLVVGSIAHFYPHVFVNMLVIIPALIWSMYLLYKGVPALLNTTPQQGMLMASSLIGVLLVAAVTLLGITVVLWTSGFGPMLGL